MNDFVKGWIRDVLGWEVRSRIAGFFSFSYCNLDGFGIL